jgi:hypothetical protein
MANFMGPMAPPQAAPPQPQKLDIRTSPGQRQQFKDFMRQRTAMMPMTSAPVAPPPMMPMMPQMQPQMPLRMQMGGSVDVFDPMYSAPMMSPPAPVGFFEDGGSTRRIEQRLMKNGKIGLFMGNEFLGTKQSGDPDETFAERVGFGEDRNILNKLKNAFGFESGGAVPPRNTNISGQPHMLSYITPDEADILEALGGSGEPGPMGIPAFPPAGQSGPGANVGPDNGGGGGGDGPDRGMSPGRSQAQFGTTEFAGKTEQEAKDELAGGGGSDRAQAVQDNLAAQAAAEAARAEAERARKAREVQAQIQRAIAVSQEQKAKQQQDLANRQVDRFEAGFNQIGPTPETNISATSGTSPSDSFGIESTDITTDKYAEEAADLLGLADDLLGIPDDLVETRPEKAPTSVDDVDDRPEVLGMDDEYEDVVGTPDYDDPNRSGYKDGLPTGLEFADTRRGRFTTNLAGLTAAQRAAMPGYMNTIDPVTGEVREGIVAGLVDTVFGNPAENVYGYEFDDTGRVTGMVGPSQVPGLIGGVADFFGNIFGTPPETTEDLLNRGVYTGFGEGSTPDGPQGDGPDQPVVKSPTDPCPDGFALKDGVCTPIAPTSTDPNQIGGVPATPLPPAGPVVVPSTRQPITNTLQGPVGYGVPTAGQINPFAVSSAAQYQQMLNQQAMNPPQFAPIKFQDGGSVSSNLDRAADSFLKSLMPAA